MPDLVAGSQVLAADYPTAGTVTDDTTISGITTESYVAGSPVVELTFTAPTSGRVLLETGGAAFDNASTPVERVLMAPEVYAGVDTGGDVVLPLHAGLRGWISCNTADQPAAWSRIILLEGLEPSHTHYVRLMYRAHHPSSTPDSAEIRYRELHVIPVP